MTRQYFDCRPHNHHANLRAFGAVARQFLKSAVQASALHPGEATELRDTIDSAVVEPLGERKCPSLAVAEVGSGQAWWARQGLNLRPLRCEHSALPLSYAPTPIRQR